MKAVSILKKDKLWEIILYLVFGVLTTVINIAVFYLFFNIIGFSTAVSNIIAWLASVLFAYVTNRLWVFSSKARGLSSILKEAIGFFSSRIFTGVLDLAFMVITVDMLGWNDFFMKILSNVVVIVLNFILSKFLVFKASRGNNG